MNRRTWLGAALVVAATAAPASAEGSFVKVKQTGANGNVSLQVDSSVTQNIGATGSANGSASVQTRQSGAATATVDGATSTMNPGTIDASTRASAQQRSSTTVR